MSSFVSFIKTSSLKSSSSLSLSSSPLFAATHYTYLHSILSLNTSTKTTTATTISNNTNRKSCCKHATLMSVAAQQPSDHREPMIRFRYGKRPTKDFVANASSKAPTATSTSASTPAPKAVSSPSSSATPQMIDPASFFASDSTSWQRDNAKSFEAYSSLPNHLQRKVVAPKILETIELGGAEPYESKAKGKQ
jgi:hypothetical protein